MRQPKAGSSSRSSEPSCVSSHGGFLPYDSKPFQGNGGVEVNASLSLEEVSTRLLAAQKILNPALVDTITHPRALLLLSRPVASVVIGDEEATVLEFYGLYWVLEVGGARTAFFNREDDAVRYLQGQMSVTEEGGKGDG